LALALLIAPAVFAGDSTRDLAAQREATARQIEGGFLKLLASEEVEPTYRELGGGLFSLSYPISDELLKGLEASGLDPKAANFQPLAAGQQLSEPSSSQTLIHAALSNRTFDYNYWWVVLNLTNQDRTRTTNAKKAGPGRKFNRNFNVTYDAMAVNLIWYNPGFGVGQAGVQVFQVNVPTGGKVVVKSYAQ
jgi:hypothetical protein